MKTAIITGAYGVIGKEIVFGIVRAGFNTMLVGRDEGKLQKVRAEVQATHPDVEVRVQSLDVSSKSSIFRFAGAVHQPVDVLVNNAATAPPMKTLTSDGIEMQWATNVLGYFWMIRAFENHLTDSGHGRIVNVASYWAGGLDLDDPEFIRRPYHNDLAYRQSKQGDRMMTYGFSEIFKDKIIVNTCHPGDANSKLSNDLGFGGSESARQAASTPVFLATSQEAGKITGAYFENCRKTTCRFQANRKETDRLMEMCGNY